MLTQISDGVARVTDLFFTQNTAPLAFALSATTHVKAQADVAQTLKKARSELHHAVFLVAAKAVQNHNSWSLFMGFQVFGQLQHACKIQAVRWEIDIDVHD